MGWVCVHDRGGALEAVRRGLFALSQLILGANSAVLSALPDVLTPVAGSSEVRAAHIAHATRCTHAMTRAVCGRGAFHARA